MDLPIQMRCLDLLVKVVRHDTKHVPNYEYVLQRPPAQAVGGFCPLPRSTPEAEGVPSAAVERCLLEAGASPSVAAHSMLLARNGRIIGEASWAPYRADVPHMAYSLSKSFTGTAVGMAVGEGLVDIDERLCDIFPEYVGVLTPRGVKAYTVRHLLTMSTGSRCNEMGSMLEADWAKLFMETQPRFEPGSAFEYNSMNSYMLSAVLHKKAGQGLVEFLRPRLFEPLGMGGYSWEVCPRGLEKGGWGLCLRIEDALKLALLYMQNGVWQGRRLLGESWVKQATSAQVPTPYGECKSGYGYQIWVNPHGFQFNGAFGQFVVALPRLNAAMAVFGGSSSLYMATPLQGILEGCFFGAGPALPENPPAQARLKATACGLGFCPPGRAEGLGVDGAEFARMAALLHGQEFCLAENHAGLFPQVLTAVHGNFAQGVSLVRFERANGGLKLAIYEKDEKNTLFIDGSGAAVEQWAGFKGERRLLGVSGRWKLGQELCLELTICFLETPDTRVLRLRLPKDGRLKMEFLEYPTLEGAGAMLMELVGYSRTALLRRLAFTLERAPQGGSRISDVVRAFTAPAAVGSPVKDNSAPAENGV